MNGSRNYDMRSRSAATEATRERILDQAQRQFLEHWYEDVTLEGVAEGAGVSGQTVLNHFGSKEGLFAAFIERAGAEIEARREQAEPGDLEGAIRILFEDYELTGDAVVRLLALEQRLEVAGPVIERGRVGHREWVERVFERPDLATELALVLDVYSWKQLRRDRGMSFDETTATVLGMVEALLATPRRKPRKKRGKG